MTVPSFNGVNYSLRPSKTIQRGLVFEGLRLAQETLAWSRAYYIGFGSIWFTDFAMAHRVLRIKRMISIERNSIGFRRAVFNKPYRFVRVKKGESYDVLPVIFQQERISSSPTILWLDYDGPLDEDKIGELRDRVEGANDDSVVLVTFDASEKYYGDRWRHRISRLGQLFGSGAVDDLTRADVIGDRLAATMGQLVMDMFQNVSTRMRKSNACVPAFNIPYKDKAPMATVGAIFPAENKLRGVRRIVRGSSWPGFVDEPVVAPHLTSKEVAVLQAKLPWSQSLTRSEVRELGFDLELEQLRAFQLYYRHYPTFAQVLS